MNETPDTHEGPPAGPEESMDARQASELLQRTSQEAQRRFGLTNPGLSLIGAVSVLIALGAVWLSVRNQHPYKGPTAAALLVMYGIIFAWIAVVVRFRRRATAGLSGRSIRQERAFGIAVLTALVAVSVYQGVLKYQGVSLGIVYGTYPVTAQLIVLGVLGSLAAAAREDWLEFAGGIAVALVAAGSAFAGPRGVWLSDGIGLCVIVLASALVQSRRLRVAR